MQDTLRQKTLLVNDTLKQTADTVVSQQKVSDPVKTITVVPKTPEPLKEITDTTTVCTRDVIASVTFYDSTSFVRSLDVKIAYSFPYTFTGKTDQFRKERKESISKTLRPGSQIPKPVYQSDWIVPLAVFTLFLFAVVRTFPGSLFRTMVRYALMRGINDNSSREPAIIFQWQATLLNLASFISISLFGFLATRHYSIEFQDIGGFLTWAICLGVVVVSVTMRHFICIITGNVSGQSEIFREYLTGIYHFYRIFGIFSLILSLLILYILFLAPGTWFITGFIAAGLIYFLRIIRLLLIFLIRRVSILYLILYLCALEILPVVIIVKYITGLV
jgi:hypothetical protein